MASAPDALTAGRLLAEHVRCVAGVCGVPDAHARQLLELAGHNVERAVALHLDVFHEVPQHVQLAAAAPPPPPPPRQGGGSGPHGRDGGRIALPSESWAP